MTRRRRRPAGDAGQASGGGIATGAVIFAVVGTALAWLFNIGPFDPNAQAEAGSSATVQVEPVKPKTNSGEELFSHGIGIASWESKSQDGTTRVDVKVETNEPVVEATVNGEPVKLEKPIKKGPLVSFTSNSTKKFRVTVNVVTQVAGQGTATLVINPNG
jgi:hypothetical protein